MHETVTAKVAHTGANKWRIPGESYKVETKYAVILAAIGKVTRHGPVAAPQSDGEGGQSAPLSAAVRLEDLKAQYEAKFGKKPHHRMTEESIAAALAGDE